MLSSFSLDRKSGVPLHRQVQAEVTRAILRGAVAGGDALPSAIELAAAIGINQNTVRLAYQDLAHDGLLTNVRGRWMVAPDLADRRDRARSATLDDLHECVRDLLALGMSNESISAECTRAIVSRDSREPTLLLETFLTGDVV